MLASKTALITGARTGIGFETALALAQRKCKIIMADRCDQKQAMQAIIDESGNDNIDCETIDLGCFQSIRDFASKINAKKEKLDILINNAGIFCMDKKETVDCLDGVMQVNHLGPLLLTHLLIDKMKKTDGARIIFVTSQVSFLHNMTVEKLSKPDYFCPHFISGALHYYNTKLCNMISAKKFAETLAQYNITCNSVHPGMTSTDFLVSGAGNDLFGNLKRNLTREVLKCTTKNVKDAAATQVFLATSPGLRGITGKYFVDYQVHTEPQELQNKVFINEIWKKSERLVGL